MVYRCSICGYVYDEEKQGAPFSELTQCPVCKQPPEKFAAVKPGSAGGRSERGRKTARFGRRGGYGSELSEGNP